MYFEPIDCTVEEARKNARTNYERMCEFDTYELAFADLVKYINEGKIKGLFFEENIMENTEK